MYTRPNIVDDSKWMKPVEFKYKGVKLKAAFRRHDASHKDNVTLYVVTIIAAGGKLLEPEDQLQLHSLITHRTFPDKSERWTKGRIMHNWSGLMRRNNTEYKNRPNLVLVQLMKSHLEWEKKRDINAQEEVAQGMEAAREAHDSYIEELERYQAWGII